MRVSGCGKEGRQFSIELRVETLKPDCLSLKFVSSIYKPCGLA